MIEEPVEKKRSVKKQAKENILLTKVSKDQNKENIVPYNGKGKEVERRTRSSRDLSKNTKIEVVPV